VFKKFFEWWITPIEVEQGLHLGLIVLLILNGVMSLLTIILK
jgi:hypothetical protein